MAFEEYEPVWLNLPAHETPPAVAELIINLGNGISFVADAPVVLDAPRFASDPPVPPIVWRAFSLLWASLRHLCDGLRRSPEALQAERLAVCRACAHLRSDGRCGLIAGKGCGCKVAIKSAWLSERCPVGKWPDYGRKDAWWRHAVAFGNGTKASRDENTLDV